MVGFSLSSVVDVPVASVHRDAPFLVRCLNGFPRPQQMALACMATGLSGSCRWNLGIYPRPRESCHRRWFAPAGIDLVAGNHRRIGVAGHYCGSGKRLPLSPRHLRLYVICGVVGTALPTTLTFAIAPRIPVSVFSILQSLTPLLTYLIAVAFRIDGVSPIRIAGIMMGFVAICLLVGPASASVGSASTVWLLLCLIVPLSYASENNIIATIRPDGIDDLTVLTGMLICGALATLPAVIVMDAFAPLSVPFGRIEWATLGMVDRQRSQLRQFHLSGSNHWASVRVAGRLSGRRRRGSCWYVGLR